MEKKSSAGFVSLSAFLHGLAMLGLVAFPAMKLLPSGDSNNNVEFVTESGAASPIEATTTSTTVTPETMQPEAKQVVQPKPLPVAKPEVVKIARTLPPKKWTKKIVEVDASQSDDNTIPAQAADESLADNQESTAEHSNEDQVVDDAAEAAATAAVAKQQVLDSENDKQDQSEELAAPKTQPAVEKLSDIAQNGGGHSLGDTDTGAMAGPSSDELRSYLDLKQLSGNKPPQYPSQARRSGQQGQVLLNYYVTPQGKVKDVRIAQSSGYPELDREAVRAAEKFNFVAGQEGWTSHPVVFSLKGLAAPATSRLRTAGSSANRSE